MVVFDANDATDATRNQDAAANVVVVGEVANGVQFACWLILDVFKTGIAAVSMLDSTRQHVMIVAVDDEDSASALIPVT